MQKTIVATVVTALIVGGGIYFWQQQKTPQPQSTTQVSDVKQSESLSQPTSPMPSTEPVKASPQFSTIDKYVDLALDSSTRNQYKTNKPSGFERVKFGSQGEGIDVAPDGVSANVFVVAKSNWDAGNLEDIATFYLEVVGPSPCWTEPNCNEPNAVDYYGPFQGKLKLLVQ